GLCLAHADRRRAGVRRLLGQRWARLVHLRKQEHARHTRRVRRAVHRDPDRPLRGKPDLPQHRSGNRASLGHAVLSAEVAAIALTLPWDAGLAKARWLLWPENRLVFPATAGPKNRANLKRGGKACSVELGSRWSRRRPAFGVSWHRPPAR